MFASNTSQVSADQLFVEDVFSTYLYSGTSAAQTITNGIDLAGKGGLVWSKGRNQVGYNNCLMDTARSGILFSDTAQSANDYATDIQSYNANGFTLKAQSSSSYSNIVGTNYVSWTFRKAPKFFDVVTYTGNGSFSQVVNHSLGSTPGFIVIKRTNATSNWATAARLSAGSYAEMYLNTTDANLGTFSPSATSTSVTVGGNWTSDSTYPLNASGATYVMYLFAHDTATDGVIQCGSFTTDGSGIIPTVNLGWEPQWMVFKQSSTTGNWAIADTMRGWYDQTADQFNRLQANTSAAEASGANGPIPTATGFKGPGVNFGANTTYVYIAIRRGPMRTPTSGTQVFSAIASSASTGTVQTTGFPVDMQMLRVRTLSDSWEVVDRLRGVSSTSTEAATWLSTNSTNAEQTTGGASNNWNNTGFSSPSNVAGLSDIFLSFRRAPGFFDEVCYTGTGSATTQSHGLSAVPELMIVKSRTNGTTAWTCYAASLGASGYIDLNSNNASATSANMWNATAPTASVFSVGIAGRTNESGANLVAYLFASCPGVSKVGSYTGTGTTLQVNCGFSGGARFVLIKRTDSSGDWYVWDTARGIVSGNDPYLLLNSTAAEVTSTDYVDAYSAGFEISSTAPAAINASGGTFIYLAIA